MFCSICFTPSPHITAIFRFWAFLFCVPLWLYLLNAKIAQKSILCVWEVFLYCVLFFVFQTVNEDKTTTVIYRTRCGHESLPHLEDKNHYGDLPLYIITAIFRFWAFLCICPCVSSCSFWTSLRTYLRACESYSLCVLCVLFQKRVENSFAILRASCWVCSVPCVQKFRFGTFSLCSVPAPATHRHKKGVTNCDTLVIVATHHSRISFLSISFVLPY